MQLDPKAIQQRHQREDLHATTEQIPTKLALFIFSVEDAAAASASQSQSVVGDDVRGRRCIKLIKALFMEMKVSDRTHIFNFLSVFYKQKPLFYTWIVPRAVAVCS